MQIDFDPEQISYEQLLDLFWRTRNHCEQQGDRQYMSAVFYHDETQRELAERTRAEAAARHGYPITTQVLALDRFYRAEDYHQKYSLRRQGFLFREFQAMYADEQGIVDSTAAARLNGFLAGYGKPREDEIDRYGLTADGVRALRAACR